MRSGKGKENSDYAEWLQRNTRQWHGWRDVLKRDMGTW